MSTLTQRPIFFYYAGLDAAKSIGVYDKGGLQEDKRDTPLAFVFFMDFFMKLSRFY